MRQGSFIFPVMIFVLMGVLLFGSVQPVQGQAPGLAILTETVTFKEGEPAGTLQGVVVVQNNTAKDLVLDFALVIDGAEAAPVINEQGKMLSAYKTGSFILTTTADKPLKGFLVVSDGNALQVTAPFGMTFKPAYDINYLLWFGVLIGYILPVAAVLLWSRHKINQKVKKEGEKSPSGQTTAAVDPSPKTLMEVLRQRIMAELEWDFTKNWGSTFTLLGAFFIALSGASLMPPEPQLFSASAYQLVIVAGPALIALAPMLIASLNSTGVELEIVDKQGKKIPVTVGTSGKPPLLVYAYLLGSGVVTLAVTIEIGMLLVYLFELQLAGTIAISVIVSSLFLIVLLWLVGMYYSCERVMQVILSAETDDAILKSEKEKFDQSQKTIKTWELISEPLKEIATTLKSGAGLKSASVSKEAEEAQEPVAEESMPVWAQQVQTQVTRKVYLP